MASPGRFEADVPPAGRWHRRDPGSRYGRRHTISRPADGYPCRLRCQVLRAFPVVVSLCWVVALQDGLRSCVELGVAGDLLLVSLLPRCDTLISRHRQEKADCRASQHRDHDVDAVNEGHDDHSPSSSAVACGQSGRGGSWPVMVASWRVSSSAMMRAWMAWLCQ